MQWLLRDLLAEHRPSLMWTMRLQEEADARGIPDPLAVAWSLARRTTTLIRFAYAVDRVDIAHTVVTFRDHHRRTRWEHSSLGRGALRAREVRYVTTRVIPPTFQEVQDFCCFDNPAAYAKNWHAFC
jgi:hypothetical protein